MFSDANAKLYKCMNKKCGRPQCYAAHSSATKDCPPCAHSRSGGTMQLLRHISFVDCPGHEILMSTMLNGVSVMDGALLLVAGNESCPQPQTAEHIAALEMMMIKGEQIAVLQNKVDLVTPEDAFAQHEAIAAFTSGTVAGKSLSSRSQRSSTTTSMR